MNAVLEAEDAARSRPTLNVNFYKEKDKYENQSDGRSWPEGQDQY